MLFERPETVVAEQFAQAGLIALVLFLKEQPRLRVSLTVTITGWKFTVSDC